MAHFFDFPPGPVPNHGSIRTSGGWRISCCKLCPFAFCKGKGSKKWKSENTNIAREFQKWKETQEGTIPFQANQVTCRKKNKICAWPRCFLHLYIKHRAQPQARNGQGEPCLSHQKICTPEWRTLHHVSKPILGVFPLPQLTCHPPTLLHASSDSLIFFVFRARGKGLFVIPGGNRLIISAVPLPKFWLCLGQQTVVWWVGTTSRESTHRTYLSWYAKSFFAHAHYSRKNLLLIYMYTHIYLGHVLLVASNCSV